MRELLAPHAGRRLQLTAVVERFGCRPCSPSLAEVTVLLTGVADAQGRPLADHVWLPVGKRLAALAPRAGDVLAFTAVPTPYRKGRIRRPDGTITAGRLDYKLARPANVRRIERSAQP